MRLVSTTLFALLLMSGCVVRLDEDALPDLFEPGDFPETEVGTAVVSATEGGVITSDDGRLVLEIPPGALTHDTPITVTALEPDELGPMWDGVEQVVAPYRFEPDGLPFDIPARVTLRVDREALATPDDVDGQWLWTLASTTGGDPLEQVDVEVSEEDDTTLLVSAELAHFSDKALVPGLTAFFRTTCYRCKVGPTNMLFLELANNTDQLAMRVEGDIFGAPPVVVDGGKEHFGRTEIEARETIYTEAAYRCGAVGTGALAVAIPGYVVNNATQPIYCEAEAAGTTSGGSGTIGGAQRGPAPTVRVLPTCTECVVGHSHYAAVILENAGTSDVRNISGTVSAVPVVQHERQAMSHQTLAAGAQAVHTFTFDCARTGPGAIVASLSYGNGGLQTQRADIQCVEPVAGNIEDVTGVALGGLSIDVAHSCPDSGCEVGAHYNASVTVHNGLGRDEGFSVIMSPRAPVWFPFAEQLSGSQPGDVFPGLADPLQDRETLRLAQLSNGAATTLSATFSCSAVGLGRIHTVTRTASGSHLLYRDAFVSCVAPTEPDRRVGFIPSPTGGEGEATGHAVAPDGTHYVRGQRTTITGEHGFVSAIGADGEPRWVYGFPSMTHSEITSLSVAPDGAIYVGGAFEQTIELGGLYEARGQRDAFVAKLSPDGELLFGATAGGGGDDAVRFVAAEPEGGVIVVGDFAGEAELWGMPVASGPARNVFTARMTPDGEAYWVSLMSTGEIDYTVTAAAVGPEGQIAIAGERHDELAAGTYVLSVAPQSGEPLWSRLLIGEAEIAALAWDGSGELFAAGRVDGAVDLDGEPLEGEGLGMLLSLAGDDGSTTGLTRLFGQQGGVVAPSELWIEGDRTLVAGAFAGTVGLEGDSALGSEDSSYFMLTMDADGTRSWAQLDDSAERAPSAILHADDTGALRVSVLSRTPDQGASILTVP